MTPEDLARLTAEERTLYERSKDDCESRMIVGSEVRQILSRLAQARAVVEAAREWKKSHDWASKNPEKMLSSRMTGDEAAEVMREYFDKEAALLAALLAHDAALRPGARTEAAE